MDTTIQAAAIRLGGVLHCKESFVPWFMPFSLSGLSMGCGHCSAGLLLHPETLGYRAHQQIGEEANHPEPSHDLQDQGIGLLAGQVHGDVMVQNPVYDKWPHDACH